MPRILIPKKSGPHRIACFALYRALLTHCERLPVLAPHKTSLKECIRYSFRKKRDLTSHRLVLDALREGYEANAKFQDSIAGDNLITELLIQKAAKFKPKWSSSSQNRTCRPNGPASTTKGKESPGDNIAKTTSESSIPLHLQLPVLQRPFPVLSGPRHVPQLVSANKVPFLRLGKPQPRAITRMIVSKLRRRTRRLMGLQRIREQIDWGFREDVWDQLLMKIGVPCPDENEIRWVDSFTEATKSVEILLREEAFELQQVAERMQDVVEKEQSLAEQERVEKKTRKARERFERRSARVRAQDEGEGEVENE